MGRREYVVVPSRQSPLAAPKAPCLYVGGQSRGLATMNDLAEALIYLFKHYLGIDIPLTAIPFLIFTFYLVPIIVSSTLAFLLFRRYAKTATNSLNLVTENLSQVAGRLEQRLEVIHTSVRLIHEVNGGDADQEVEQEPTQDAPRAKAYRYHMAKSASDKVMEKWVEGSLKQDQVSPGIFTFNGFNDGGNKYYISLSTPYRPGFGTDGRMAYALEVWSDGYKKLNFEWTHDGQYKLRGFTKGDWVEDLSVWLIRPLVVNPSTSEREATAA